MQIISVNRDEDTEEVNTTISLPCNSEISDELGNIWKLVGPYKEVCDSERTFYKLKSNGRLSNKEWFCIKDGATKKYSNSVECEVEVKCAADCCIQNKKIRYSYQCNTEVVKMQHLLVGGSWRRYSIILKW
jgi:hypothetical protein